MAITKRVEEQKVQLVGPFDNIEFLRVLIIEEDGVEISRTNLPRYVIEPDSDISQESERIKSLAAVLHTPEIKASHAAAKEALGLK